MPIVLDALASIEHTSVGKNGFAHESVACKATRKARKWSRLANGGLATRNLKSVQDR